MPDPKEHLDLIAKLIAVSHGASPQYVEQSLSAEQLAAQRSLAEEFIKGGGRLRIWHTRLLSYLGPGIEKPVPPGEQIVIVMITNTRYKDDPRFAAFCKE